MTLSKKLVMIILNYIQEVIQDECIQETSDDNIQLEEVIQDECIQETRHDNGNME